MLKVRQRFRIGFRCGSFDLDCSSFGYRRIFKGCHRNCIGFSHEILWILTRRPLISNGPQRILKGFPLIFGFLMLMLNGAAFHYFRFQKISNGCRKMFNLCPLNSTGCQRISFEFQRVFSRFIGAQ